MTIAFWIAHGQSYISEAAASAASFKLHNPHVATMLWADESTNGFDFYTRIERTDEPWYLFSTSVFCDAVNNIHDDTLLYFDTDTRTLANLDDLIELIGRFDVVGAHAPARLTAPTIEPVPDAFPELNIGVLGLHNTEAVRAMTLNWLMMYRMFVDVYGNNDQAPLREALWYSDVSVYVMPPEYNCRFGFGGFAAYPVKVLHNRGYSFERAAEYLNAQAGMRVWRGSDLP